MILVRPATPDDAAAVAELVASLLTELGGAPGELDAVARDVLAKVDRTAGFLALDDGRAVGVIMLSEGYAMFARGAFGQITELYVRPELRSAGIAARLLELAVAHGQERGWRRIDVGAPREPDWARTVAFYKSNGFVEVGPRLKLAL
ncbi:GNAT family N-acetyltransferase [Paraburkholderia bannensis]|uniref:GNAT family N-acetyltransferase n=1 Tax=Paraburkholderia bannensis TaxID=765414 RepID=UPI002AC34547|nr:GNAT family N-acetyltransferase [Paraburkholderia bannensis]